MLCSFLEPCDSFIGAARGGVNGIAVRVSGVRMSGDLGFSLPIVVVKVWMGLWMAVMFRMEVEVVGGGMTRGRRIGRGLDIFLVRWGEGGLFCGIFRGGVGVCCVVDMWLLWRDSSEAA